MRIYILVPLFALLSIAACSGCDLNSDRPAVDAPATPIDMPPDMPIDMPDASLDAPVRVSMGHHVACAVMTSGKVRCWGVDDFGQLGVPPADIAKTCSAFGRTAKCRETPVEVPSLTDVASVQVGFFHACAVKTDATVVCWGRNADGELGHDPAGDELCSGQPCSTPRAVAGLTDIAEVVVAADHSCARTAGGAVRCWGQNGNGTLGTGAAGGTSFTPVAATGLASGVTRIATAAFSHTTCALKGGEVFCWGFSFEQGNLGTPPTSAPQPTPTKITGIANAIDLAIGERVGCALIMDGTVTCWGANLHGQTGISPTEPSRFQPKVVPGLAQITALTGSLAVTCARAAAGNVLCWGASSTGALGNNSFAGDACALAPCRATPVSADLANVEQLSLGTSGIALDSSGVVRAWGTNGFGELGRAPGSGNDAVCGSGNCNATPTVVTFPPP
jgi:alpha-tubulin suppressor-like RCC1 family protein